MKQIFWFLFLLAFVLLSSKKVFAWQVTINEFVPNSTTEWVEFFNSSASAEYLKSYFLDDDTDFTNDSGSGTKKSLNTLNIGNSTYPVFETSGFLNNTGDYVVIFSEDGSIVDQYQYTSDPGSGVSIGRIPDGSGAFVTLSSTTKGIANIASTTTPTETPTLTTTPSPSPTTTKSVYKINKPRDNNNQTLSSVKIYVDGIYSHHEDDELLEFCDTCFCDNSKSIPCGYGQHTIRLEKTGYQEWIDQRNIVSNGNYDVSPILISIATPTPTPTPTSTPTSSPTNATTPTPTKITATPTPSITTKHDQITLPATPTAEIVISPQVLATISSDVVIKKPFISDKNLFLIGIIIFAGSGGLLYFRLANR